MFSEMRRRERPVLFLVKITQGEPRILENIRQFAATDILASVDRSHKDFPIRPL